MLLAGMDATSKRHPITPLQLLLKIMQNPVILGAVLGILTACTNIIIPDLVIEPVHIIGAAAVPAMLLAFGMSLNGTIPLQAADGQRRDTLLAASFKLMVHPLLAYAFAAFVLHQESTALFAAVVMAALPTAQNTFVIASRYETLSTATKDTVLITTLTAAPAMIAIALLLS